MQKGHKNCKKRDKISKKEKEENQQRNILWSFVVIISKHNIGLFAQIPVIWERKTQLGFWIRKINLKNSLNFNKRHREDLNVCGSNFNKDHKNKLEVMDDQISVSATIVLSLVKDLKRELL